MKIDYIKLNNVAGLKVGLDIDELEIDMSKSTNKIIAIQAKNGSGKSVLMSSLSPFAYVTSLDERSSLPYIIKGKNGYKEIHYSDGPDKYIIKHYFKASKESHVVKSYFMKNDEELNENGNVTSFNDLVEIHLGLTQEMMRLIRLGSNVNSFITLTPAKRKEYIGKLIDEIGLYMDIYKKVNEDIRVVKTLMQSNSSNLYQCHITDPIVEEENLASIRREIEGYEAERDKLMQKIGQIDALMRDNDIVELRKRVSDAESNISEFEKVSASIKKEGLENISVDQLINERSNLTDKRIDVQSNINSLRLTIDQIHQNIDRLERSIMKITSNNDLKSLIGSIDSLKESISLVPDSIKTFKPLSRSEDLQMLYNRLLSFNSISKMIYTFGNKPLAVYLKLRKNGVAVDRWLKEQSKKALTRLNESDLVALLDQVFGDDDIIAPNCDEAYKECPYFRLNSVISEIRDKVEEESYSDETLRYVQVISRNMDDICNEIDRLRSIKVPDRISDTLNETEMLRRLDKKLPFFDVSHLEEYLSYTKEYELYEENKARLEQCEHQLAIYQQAGVSGYSEEIEHQQTLITEYKSKISEYNDVYNEIQKRLDKIEQKIGLLTRYNDSKKYQKMLHSTLESTKKILGPLEDAANEKQELQFQLRQTNNLINTARERHKNLEHKLEQYNRLLEEGKKLKKQNKDLNIIQEAVSTRKGIPVIYMKQYLGKIQKLANDLLDIVYHGEFKLAPFNVTPDEFSVPYIKNSRYVSDLKYASQSEIALGTVALSFGLAHSATGPYNIICLDEIDAGLDTDARMSFLKMLYSQMELLHAEQVFIISHNLSQLANIPLDVISLDGSDQGLKMQSIIYP